MPENRRKKNSEQSGSMNKNFAGDFLLAKVR